ncbi:hypothetical protein [Nocardiopsis chromatogenes]|uniref:hypothetical protein n=1 Tax=Nocardiopsis chromatogenes TaxID=280239 RepID=UPI000349A4B2|nr:hypothetical protein [Nocardiopsis chromatogenes]
MHEGDAYRINRRRRNEVVVLGGGALKYESYPFIPVIPVVDGLGEKETFFAARISEPVRGVVLVLDMEPVHRRLLEEGELLGSISRYELDAVKTLLRIAHDLDSG